MHLQLISPALVTAVYVTFALAEQMYARDNSLDGYNCNTNDISFTRNARSSIACGKECSITNTCFSWFYDATDGKCYGCSVAYACNSGLLLKNGTKYHKHACGSGWIAIHRGCYLLDTAESMDFPAAWNYCVQRQSHLLYLETQGEISMITEYLLNDADTTGVNGYWVAMTDDAEVNVWRWYGRNDLVTVFNWGQLEPDNRYGGENRTTMYKPDSYQWHDVWFDNPYTPICERN